MMHAIELENLTVAYAGKPVLHNLTHTFAAGQWHVILGRSGAGKTTLLHAIAGLLRDTAQITGKITMPENAIALMAQQNDILPWRTVIDNVTLNAALHRQKPDTARALELLSACGIGEYANAKPQTLSGGQRQRIALARTLMQNQPIVLMDEPFSALDAITRRQLQDLASQLLAGKTVLMITHDPAEALRLADTLHILQTDRLIPVPLPAPPPPRRLDAAGMASAEERLITTLSGTPS